MAWPCGAGNTGPGEGGFPSVSAVQPSPARQRQRQSQRRSARWNAQGADYAAIKPGHPVYERIRAEWLAEEAAHEQDDFDAIDAMIDEMRERSLADDSLLEGPGGDDDDD